MIIDERDLRETLNRVVKGVIVIVALSVMRAVAASFLRPSASYGSMTLNSWTRIIISLVIVAFVIKLYSPVKALAAFYLSAFAKASKMPGRDKHLNHLLVVGERVVLLVFLVIIYQCLLPIIIQLNVSFFRFSDLTVFLNVAILVAVIGVLVWIWKDAQPLVELLTGRFTDKVSTLSSGLAYVSCAACGAKNDRDAMFCVSCGSKMGQQTAAPEPVNKAVCCSQCGAENAPAAKFCCKCGAAQS